MAVRDFDGTDDRIVVDNGAVGAFVNAAHSVMILVNRSTDVNTHDILELNDGGFGAPLIRLGDTDNYRYSVAAGETSAGTTTTGDWILLVVTRASSSATPRFHTKNLSTGGAWAHANGGAYASTNANTPTTISFGHAVRDGFFADVMLATAGLFTYELTDAQCESLVATPGTNDLFNVSSGGADPVAAWDFNQASVADDVLDLTAGAANETAITGTTVVTGDDPPGWVFGLGPPAPAPSMFVVRAPQRL